jgi:DnaJ-class molecular chaperone
MSKDYYIVLGASRGADLKKIKDAYRNIVKEHHPDRSASRESLEKFLEVREAYETLVDEEKRRRYDKELEEQGSSLRVTRVPETIRERKSRLDPIEQMFSAVDDFFEGFLPGFFDRKREREKELYYEAVLSPGEASRGGLFPVTVPVLEPCPRCVHTGMWQDFFCPVCRGNGRIQAEREFSLSIPSRVAHGTRIRLSMEDIGLKDTCLTVVVRIEPDLHEAY